MEVFVASVTLPRSREAAFDYLRRPANFLKMLPADAAGHLDAKLPPVMELGSLLEFNVKAWGTSIQFVHEVTTVSVPDKIEVQQIKGPFKAWIQTLTFTDAPLGQTLLTNLIQFLPPGGMLGFIVTKKVIHSNLEQWINHGLELLRSALEKEISDPPPFEL